MSERGKTNYACAASMREARDRQIKRRGDQTTHRYVCGKWVLDRLTDRLQFHAIEMMPWYGIEPLRPLTPKVSKW